VLALGCPYLTWLNLSFCGSAVSDSSLRSIGLHLLEMRYLSVRGCVRVTGVGVEAVVEGCHKLVAFDVSQCKNLVPWLEQGGIGRVRGGVSFNVVAGGWLRSATRPGTAGGQGQSQTAAVAKPQA
jgi:F-box and leucine-rich repeat protein 7